MALLCSLGICNLTDYENQIMRPRRNLYGLHDLGAPEFYLQDKLVSRFDFEQPNKKGQFLRGSVFNAMYDDKVDSVVIFLHGNGGCRKDSIPLLEHLIAYSIAVCTFDFAGCGLSDGDFITLGYNERDDVDCIVTYLQRTYPNFKNIILWGKSMGAATALMYGERLASTTKSSSYGRVCAIVADSPYSCMDDLAHQLASQYAMVPGFMVPKGVEYFRSRIKEKTGADLTELNPKLSVRSIRIPILLGVANGDELTLPSHVREVYENCRGNNPKNQLIEFYGDHFSPRTLEFYGPAVRFVLSVVTRQSVAGTKTGTSSALFGSQAAPAPTPTNRSNIKGNMMFFSTAEGVNYYGLDQSQAGGRSLKSSIFKENPTPQSLYASQAAEAAKNDTKLFLSQAVPPNDNLAPSPTQGQEKEKQQLSTIMEEIVSPIKQASPSGMVSIMQQSTASTTSEKKSFVKTKDGRIKRSIFE